jgi:hypothetical protein
MDGLERIKGNFIRDGQEGWRWGEEGEGKGAVPETT